MVKYKIPDMVDHVEFIYQPEVDYTVIWWNTEMGWSGAYRTKARTAYRAVADLNQMLHDAIYNAPMRQQRRSDIAVIEFLCYIVYVIDMGTAP